MIRRLPCVTPSGMSRYEDAAFRIHVRSSDLLLCSSPRASHLRTAAHAGKEPGNWMTTRVVPQLALQHLDQITRQTAPGQVEWVYQSRRL